MIQTKQVIYGDGVDSADVYIDGDEGQVVTYTVNDEAYTVTLGSDGRETIVITCDTPNTSVIVQYGADRAIIFAVGAP